MKATNCGGSANAVHTITINEACERPLTGAAIDGASTGVIDTQYAFTAGASPADVTAPLTYSWSPEPLSGQGTANATYQWDVAGNQTVKVKITNCGGSANAVHTITINEACERRLTGAAIDGASTGLINTNMPFPPASHRQTRPPLLHTAGHRNPSTARELPTQPINGMSPQPDRQCEGDQLRRIGEHGAYHRSPGADDRHSCCPGPDAIRCHENDLYGPGYWSNRYGKSPEIVVASNGIELDVLPGYDAGTAWDAVLLHIEPSPTGYEITQALTDIPFWIG